jgi:hypothetical protein
MSFGLYQRHCKRTAPEIGLGEGCPMNRRDAMARQQIFWKRVRQRGTLTGGST